MYLIILYVAKNTSPRKIISAIILVSRVTCIFVEMIQYNRCLLLRGKNCGNIPSLRRVLGADIQYVVMQWSRDKMVSILQTTVSNSFSWMHILEFWSKLHWNSFLTGVQLSMSQHWFRWWLGTLRVTSHYLNQYRFVYWRKDASLILWWSCLTHCGLNKKGIILQILFSTAFSWPKTFTVVPSRN